MAEHPILEICKALPENWEELTGEFIDKMHLIFSALNIHHSKDRDECFKIIIFLEELNLIESKPQHESKQIYLKQSTKTKEILKYYGK